MKKLKYLIFILIVIIIITLLAIFIANKDPKSKQEIAESQQYSKVTDESIAYENKRATLHDVDNTQDFFTAMSCVNQYYGALNQSVWSTQDSEEITTEVKKSYVKNIYNLLSSNYIDENKITESNVLNYVDNINENVFCIPLKMKMLISKDNSTKKYIVYGIQENMQNEYIKDFYTIIYIDTNNETFSVEPKNNVKNIDDISIDSNNITINKNDGNGLSEPNVTDEYVSKQYTDYYKKLVLGRPDLAYELMDKEYREKRFGSLEKYKEYIEENSSENKTSYMKQYLVNRDEQKTEYVGKDQYGRLYVFDVVTPTNYTIKLDTYTIETDYFKKEYDTDNVEKKVQMNLNKFVLMINNQDWDAAYSVLDDNFKNNYFKSVDEFKQYVKGKSYKYNDMKVLSFETTGNVYTCRMQLTDLTQGVYVDETKGTGGSAYIYNWKVNMQLGNESEFKISFEVEDS